MASDAAETDVPQPLPASLTWRAPTAVTGPVLAHAALLFWVIETLRPKAAVVVTDGDTGAFELTVHAAQKAGLSTMTTLALEEGNENATTVSAEARTMHHILRGPVPQAHRDIAPGSVDLLIIEGRAEEALQNALISDWPSLLSPGAVVFWHNPGDVDSVDVLRRMGADPADLRELSHLSLIHI